ncbi:MAG TPA: intradiol ring-cleavage dioxygenase [Terriglobales bacterium]|jgi:protocatechuate 3,4-dioxygenase beta subunit|nr:intradiol ring-cleavage dioxygenase [Terriglobales bacterium]
MSNNVLPVSRRRFLLSSVAVATTFSFRRAATAFGFAPQTDVCRLAVEEEEGPYYVAGEMLRSNIVETKPGIPLSLRILILDAGTCKPLPNAAVDVWHCDALGLYSGFTKQNPRGPGGPPPDFDPAHPGNRPGPPENRFPENPGPPPHNPPSDKLTFLRGIQITDAAGTVNFRTVFPGFYMGRTNHIHFKVRVGGQSIPKSYQAGHTSHTGQMFFPEDVATELMEHGPYSGHKIHRTTQQEDHVFGEQQGELSVVRLQFANARNVADGMHAELVAAVDPAATPAGVGFGPGPRR